MTTIICTRCSLILDQSFFINKKDGFYTRCINCREQNNEYIKKRKQTQEPILILSYKELKQRLTDMINDVGQEEYFENCETGIKFSCFVDISFLTNKTPKEMADNVKDFIGKAKKKK